MSVIVAETETDVKLWTDGRGRKWPRGGHERDPYAWLHDVIPLLPSLLHADAKLVLALWARAVRDEYRFSLNHLAHETGLSRPTLYRSLDALTDRNLIDLEQLRVKDDDGGYVSRFALRPVTTKAREA